MSKKLNCSFSLFKDISCLKIWLIKSSNDKNKILTFFNKTFINNLTLLDGEGYEQMINTTRSLAWVADSDLFLYFLDLFEKRTIQNWTGSMEKLQAKPRYLHCELLSESSWFPNKALLILHYYRVIVDENDLEGDLQKFELLRNFLHQNCANFDIILNNFEKILPLNLQKNDSFDRNWILRYGVQFMNNFDRSQST